MPTAGEGRVCPACGGSLLQWRTARARDPQLAGAPSFLLRRCTSCGTAVTVDPPGPERSAEMYEQGTYSAPGKPADVVVEPLRRLADRERLRHLRGLPPGSKVLELGAGDGRFVAAMRRAGFEAEGSEPSESARHQAAARGAALAAVKIEDTGSLTPSEPGLLPDPEGPDAVVLWHVLEHLDDPGGALTLARQALRPGGRLICAVPNLAGIQARIGGDRWFHQDVPRHRTHFTPRGLTALYGQAGFEAPRLRHFSLDQNALGMWQTLLNRITGEPDFAFRLFKRDVAMAGVGPKRDLAVTALLGLPLIPFALVLELAASAARRGGSIVAIAEPAA